jgi:hypothetical protein
MWTKLQTLIAILVTNRKEHKHEVVVQPDSNNLLKIKAAGLMAKELSVVRQEVSTLKTEALLASKALAKVTIGLSDSVTQSNLWMKKSASLQDNLSASQGHVVVLESVLGEANRTIESLTLALELREKEETEGLQNYIDELETEIDEAVELIQKYGLELRKA